MKLPERILGADYRQAIPKIGAAVFSLLSLLAALPYQLGEVSVLIPAAWKPHVFAACALSAFILRVWAARQSPPTSGPVDFFPVPEGKVAVGIAVDASGKKTVILEDKPAA